MFAAARKSAHLPWVVITSGRFTTILFSFAVLLATSVGYIISRVVYGATSSLLISVYITALSVFGLVSFLEFVYNSTLRPLHEFLGDSSELAARRAALISAVEAAARTERCATRFHVDDQLAEWGNCYSLDDGVEILMDERRALWAALRSTAALSGPLPPDVLSYVKHVELAFIATMQPDVLASAASKLLRTYLDLPSTWHWRKGSPDLYYSAFVDVNLRFNCRSNLDWAMLNAWRLASSGLFAASTAPDRLRDPIELSEEGHAAFLAWWDTPRKDRGISMPYEQVLLRAPVHVLAVRHPHTDVSGRPYPVSLLLAQSTPEDGAPPEYVVRLWQLASRQPQASRPGLARIVAAARRLTSRPPSVA